MRKNEYENQSMFRIVVFADLKYGKNAELNA